MAAATITPYKITAFNEFPTAVTSSSLFTAVDASAGGLIPWSGADCRMLIVVQNTEASTEKSFTVKAGNGIGGNKDLTVSIAAGKTVYLEIDSDRFKNMSGTNKGKVLVTGGSANVKVAVFALL